MAISPINSSRCCSKYDFSEDPLTPAAETGLDAMTFSEFPALLSFRLFSVGGVFRFSQGSWLGNYAPGFV